MACGPQAASGSPRPTGDLVDLDVAVTCRELVGAVLRAELVHMATGLPERGDPTAAIDRAYPPGSAVGDRITQVNTELLQAAASDLLGPFRRDVDALVRSYAPRIAVGCADATSG